MNGAKAILLKSQLIVVMAFLLLVNGIACGDKSAPETTLFDVSIQERIMNPNEFEVIQNDTLSMTFLSDESGTIHVHGYELHQAIVKNRKTNLTFLLNASGQFNIGFHVGTNAHEHNGHTDHSESGGKTEGISEEEFVLGVLQVYPR